MLRRLCKIIERCKHFIDIAEPFISGSVVGFISGIRVIAHFLNRSANVRLDTEHEVNFRYVLAGKRIRISLNTFHVVYGQCAQKYRNQNQQAKSYSDFGPK